MQDDPSPRTTQPHDLPTLARCGGEARRPDASETPRRVARRIGAQVIGDVAWMRGCGGSVRASLIGACFAALVLGTPGAARAGEKGGEKGSNGWEEVDRLNRLEREEFRTRRAPGEAWEPELLAPYRGTLASLRADVGLRDPLHNLPRKPPRGSQLLFSTSIRSRLDITKPFGLKQVYRHGPVRAYLDFFDGRGKGILVRWYARIGRFGPLLRRTLREEGMPEELIYVAMIESGFNPYARSPADAVGIWQFMAPTARAVGLTINKYVDERRDPVRATKAACRYLRWLHKKYNSWPLALAAYNAGQGTISRSMRKLNSNDFWFMHRQRGMSVSSRNYVPKIIAAALMSENPALFGLHAIKSWERFEFDEVQVPRSTRLSTVSRAINTSVAELRQLNPELLHAVTPPRAGFYKLRIPKGKRAAFVRQFDKIILSPNQPHTLHRVAFGETLGMIAAHYKIAPRVLRAANQMERYERLKYGRSLVIPMRGRGRWKKGGHGGIIFVPAEVVQPPGTKAMIYHVNKGDTLDAIARAMHVNVADLAIWNRLDPKANLKTYMRIQLFLDPKRAPKTLALQPASRYRVLRARNAAHKRSILRRRHRAYQERRDRAWNERNPVKGKARYHTVRHGDTIGSIAKRYGVSNRTIRRWNPRLYRDRYIRPGDRLVIRK